MKRKLRSILAGLALSFSGISTAAPELVVQSGMGSAPVIAEKPASADGAALIDWFPAITTTALLGIVLWLSRKLIVTRLTRSVTFEFDEKLEGVRAEFREKEEVLKADLRSKESEIAALRGGVLTAMASRQMALDKRRLEAVDQLWSAVTALGHAKSISKMLSPLKFDALAEEAAKNSKFRDAFLPVGAGFDIDRKIDLSGSAKARPFISPMTWALFSAYQAIAGLATLKLHIIKTGISASVIDKDAVVKLLKAALPDRSEYIDKWGDAGYHYLLEELERRLLDEMRKMLTGVEADKESAEQAADILKYSNALIESAKQ